MRSLLRIHDLASGRSHTVLETGALIEAPNWHPDGWLLVNGDGRLWRVPLDRPELLPIQTGSRLCCNNDHGFSTDGTRIFLTCHTDRGAEVFSMPVEGAEPRPVTAEAPSWWHCPTPDGREIVYASAREGSRVVDLRACSVDGGPERRLTFGEGHSDGPDISPEGEWIWYNSDRTGHAQIWRMRPDGTGHELVFADRFVNWFPHPSPCGRWVLYLAYPTGTEGHPRNLPVALRILAAGGGLPKTVAEFVGGQGTINVPCWSADGRAFAYVEYRIRSS